jgi:hypothetical protein
MPVRLFASLNVTLVVGVRKTARLRAWYRQNWLSSTRSSSSSSIAATSALGAPASSSCLEASPARFFSSMRSASPREEGLVGR